MFWLLIGILIGGYLTGVLIVFSVTMFFVMLGGKNEELYIPFVVAPLWPITLPLALLGKI